MGERQKLAGDSHMLSILRRAKRYGAYMFDAHALKRGKENWELESTGAGGPRCRETQGNGLEDAVLGVPRHTTNAGRPERPRWWGGREP